MLRNDGMSYGDDLFDYYRHTLEMQGAEEGMLGDVLRVRLLP